MYVLVPRAISIHTAALSADLHTIKFAEKFEKNQIFCYVQSLLMSKKI